MEAAGFPIGRIPGCKRQVSALFVSMFLAVPLVLAQQRPEYVSNVVVVQFAPEIVIANKGSASGLQDFDRRATRYGVHLIERVYPFLDHVEPTPKTRRNLLALRHTYYVRYHERAPGDRVAADLAAVPGVVYAEPVLVYRTQTSGTWERMDPDDPRFGEQTEMQHLRLPEAWDVVKSEDGTPRIVIAIVDGGGEWRHRDLRANVWTNPDEIAGNRIDDDGNGFIDDVHGVNFANGDDTNNDPTGLLETPRSAEHGTASAGAASAVTDNGMGIAGAAWNADIMHINVGCSVSDLGVCFGFEGILYAAANGADIINVSWSGPVSIHAAAQFYDQSLNLATDMGALVVAAASNENVSNDLFRFYPARHPRVLSVGATEKNTRTRAVFSNYGKLVNVFAPGVDILTTGSRNSYMLVNGTSFSSPLVAGVAALVKTRFPDMTADAVREQVRLTSENMDAENPGLAGQLGRGFVNAMAAIQEPSLPAVRLKRWSWADDDGDRLIASGDVVTVTATVVNYLADARQLRVGLVATEAYPFIDMTTVEVEVGSLASGDSAEVRFEFAVAMDAPPNRRVRFFTRIRDGAFEDESDMLMLDVNRSIEVVHRNLSALYTATGGDNWTRNDNWDITTVPSEEELATWYGVALSEGRLIELFLLHNNLTGALPAELGNLQNLIFVSLQHNSLSGDILPELGSLRQLHVLNLSGNSLTGTIPSEFGNLRQLKVLNLSGNSVTGMIPPQLGNLQRLGELQLSGNSLTGDIPPDIGKLQHLRILNARDNTLAGVIPPEFGNLQQLKVLNLSGNSLTGSIPPELGNLQQMGELWLSGNSLTGVIPPDLGNLLQLEGLNLSDNDLTGTVPPELGNLVQLKGLDLSSNMLTGTIPSELDNLTQLQELILSDNSLSGTIPPELGNLAQLKGLNLSSNALVGPIPPQFDTLMQLQVLILSDNSLIGTIPPELDNLTHLHWLILSDNSLTGTIPPELGSLTQLQLLILSDNSLTGAIPPEIGSLAQLQWLILNGNALTGMLPRSLMQLESLEVLHFGDQDVCAPRDNGFQAWLSSIPDVDGPTCVGLQLAGEVSDQSYPRAQPITPLVLPEVIGGVLPIDYTLTPTLPAGLSFDASTRTLSGTPTAVTAAPVPYTYKATDANGSVDSLHFTIEVYSSVNNELEALPESFEVRGNYPNPFRKSTHLVFDLPWPARVTVEVMDLTGRRVLIVPAESLAAGWERRIELRGATLSSGLYLYRLIAMSPEGSSANVGHFVRIR